MLNPFFLCGLVCVIKKFQNSGKIFTLNLDESSNINSYLKTILFPMTLVASDDDAINLRILEKYQTKTYIPLISFKTGLDTNTTRVRENILSSISQLLKNQLNFSAERIQPLAYFLDELTNNINDHSEAGEGYVFAQFYPNSNFLDLCICDPGKGITNPIWTIRSLIQKVKLRLLN